MIEFIAFLFNFVNDCLNAPYPGLPFSMGTFIYGVIVIFISIVVIARLLQLHDDTKWDTTESFTHSESRKWGNSVDTHTVTSRRKLRS